MGCVFINDSDHPQEGEKKRSSLEIPARGADREVAAGKGGVYYFHNKKGGGTVMRVKRKKVKSLQRERNHSSNWHKKERPPPSCWRRWEKTVPK